MATSLSPPDIPEELLLHFDCPDWSRDAWGQCMIMVEDPTFLEALGLALPLQPEMLLGLRARTGSADDLEVGSLSLLWNLSGLYFYSLTIMCMCQYSCIRCPRPFLHAPPSGLHPPAGRG